MGAGKTTLGADAARRLVREFLDVYEAIEERVGRIEEFFRRSGEIAFREVEATTIDVVLRHRAPHVIAIGGGAVETTAVRQLLREAFVVRVEVDVETAWDRARGSDRPLARDESEFRRRY